MINDQSGIFVIHLRPAMRPRGVERCDTMMQSTGVIKGWVQRWNYSEDRVGLVAQDRKTGEDLRHQFAVDGRRSPRVKSSVPTLSVI